MTRHTEAQLVTVDEAAQLLAVTPAAIRKWLSQGRLTKVKVGRLTRLRLADLEEVAASGLPQEPLSRLARRYRLRHRSEPAVRVLLLAFHQTIVLTQL